MANGEEHAKQTVLSQADALEQKLSNGHAGDPATHGNALLLLLQMVRPIFEAKLMTAEACQDRCARLRCSKKPLSWSQAVLYLGAVITVVVGMLRILGKL